jgi:hypothetical protein
MPRGRPPKYAPLAGYLAALTADEVRLTLAEIEQIIGAPLAAWVRQPTFWSNSPAGVLRPKPWTRAGWRVVRTELQASPPAVHFARVTMPPRAAAR